MTHKTHEFLGSNFLTLGPFWKDLEGYVLGNTELHTHEKIVKLSRILKSHIKTLNTMSNQILKRTSLIHFFIFFSVCLAWLNFVSWFYYSAYFCYYSWVSLLFLVLFMGATVLFQLTFTFIYNTFSKKFLVSAK